MWRLLRSIKGRRRGQEETPGPPDREEAPPIAPRHRLRVSFNLSVLDPRSTPGVEPPSLMLEGHTHDVSATGLALVVPSLSLAGRDLSRDGQSFLLELELPKGPLRFQAAAARHERLEAEGEESYVLGVRITEISERDRARLARFLKDARREASA